MARSRWTPAHDRRGHPVLNISFAMQDGGPCPYRQAWTQTQAASPRRPLTIRPQARYEALHAAKGRPSSRRRTISELVLKVPFRTPSEPTVSVTHAPEGMSTCLCNRLARRQHSLSLASLPGCSGTREHPLVTQRASMGLFLRVRQQYPQGWRPVLLTIACRLHKAYALQQEHRVEHLYRPRHGSKYMASKKKPCILIHPC
jgi:hypothetical protein